MSDSKNPPFLQGADNLRMAASMAAVPIGTCAAPTPPARGDLAIAAKAMEATSRRTPPAHTCRQRLKLSFYFDGTGNNREADLPTFEHSNVARMFRVAPDDSEKDGIFSFYIPGLGTYFREIGDMGEDIGKATGKRGEARLQWALNKLQERRNAAQNLTGIDIALIGFSRGAALARAFANRVQKLCALSKNPNEWVLKGTTIGVEIYFLGLWDTVASAGLPKSINNQSLLRLIAGAARGVDDPPLQRMRERDVSVIAYGRPGADPSPSTMWSWADGHNDWGAEMAIPPIVSKGVHMMAGHEIRNSFPVDTVRHGERLPPSFEGEESIYPGSHSDVGGGYRPGEGARSPRKGQQMSLLTLRVMYEKARSAGVPLLDLNDEKVVANLRLDFAIALPSDPEENHAAARDFAELQRLWNRYLDHCGRVSKPLGQWFLAHMKVYYAWRFWNIRKNRVERMSGKPTDDERAVEPIEKKSRQEQGELDRKIAAQERSAPVQQARRDTAAARSRLQQSQERLSLAQHLQTVWMVTTTPQQAQQMLADRQQREALLRQAIADAEGQLAAAEQAQSLAEDPLRRLEAQKATLPSQGTLGRNWQQYDDRLYDDAKQLSEAKFFRHFLRPHYKTLVEAWEDEFLHNRGLVNNDVMKFFETYVHDSLADFAQDATLPSDPRVVYVGSDEVERFAMLNQLQSIPGVRAA